MKLPKVGFIPIQFIQEDKAATELSEKACSKLKDTQKLDVLKANPVFTAQQARNAVRRCFAEDVDVVIYFISCWIDSSVVISAVQEVGMPYIVWGCSDLNTQSLLGAVEAVTSLKNLEEKFKAVYGDPGDEKTVEEIVTRAKAARVLKKLRRAKIGFIGGITFGMYDAVHDLVALREKLGVDVVHLDQYRIIEEMDRIPESDVEAAISKASNRVGRVEAGKEHMVKSFKIYLALKRLIEKFEFDAIMIKCHPDLSQIYGACGCIGASLLIDDDLPCACEGNLYTAVTMLILHELTGSPPFCHEISAVDTEGSTMLLWHCGAGAPSLAKNPSEVTLKQQYAAPVEKGGQMGGVTLDFWVKAGNATIAILGGVCENIKMQISQGEILEPRKMDLGAGKIWARALIKVPDAEKFIKETLGHQFVTVHGEVEKELTDLCDLANIPTV